MTKWLFGFLCSILLAACTPSGTQVDVTPVAVAITAASPLDGTAWELAEINGRSLILDSRITLNFDSSTASGYSGCNDFQGAYTATADGTLSIPEIAITTVMCSKLREQEATYIQALYQADRYTISTEGLQITTADGQTTLIFTPLPQYDMNPADLIDTGWQLLSWEGYELPANSGITLIFDNSDTMQGFAGWRHYSGSYFAKKDALQFPALGMKEGTYEVAKEVLLLEGNFTTALSETTQYRLQDGQLTLFTKRGNILLFAPLLPNKIEETTNTPYSNTEAVVNGCPDAVSGTQQFIDFVHGICFLYPSTYNLFQGEDAVSLFVESAHNTEAPLVLINFEAVNGRSLDDLTKQRLTDYAYSDTQPQSIMLGGQPAVMLDNLPGQDGNRRVFTIHNDTVVDLMVARIGEDYDEVGTQAEMLYALIINSFHLFNS